ncbi:Replication initiation protein [compost metagenome]
MVPHLTMLNKEFTSYQLRQIGKLSTFYAIRLYELMAQFLKLKERECTLVQLRSMLDLGDKYTNVKDLRKRVLDPAIKEVNLHTDLTITAEPRRKGRTITGFTFTIHAKASGEQQLELIV